MKGERERPPRRSNFMRRKQVADELGVSRRTLLQIVKTDMRFPPFFRIAPGIDVIERRDFDRWIRLRKMLAERDAAQE